MCVVGVLWGVSAGGAAIAGREPGVGTGDLGNARGPVRWYY